jgi:hypothetical protein
MPQQRAARIGQGHGSRRPHQQLRTHPVLQFADLGAQGLLGDMQADGGAGEVQFLGDHLERPQVTELGFHNGGL